MEGTGIKLVERYRKKPIFPNGNIKNSVFVQCLYLLPYKLQFLLNNPVHPSAVAGHGKVK